MVTKKDEPLVSINIPTWNSERTLDKCLRSAINQVYCNIEIIVIDSYSHDRTLEIAKKYNAKVFFAKTLAEARRIGVEKSLGKYVFFLDSDQMMEADTIIRCVKVCEDGGYDMVTLFEQSIIQRNTFIERVIAYDKWLFHSLHDDHPIYGAAIPRFFKTEILRKITWPEDIAVQEHNIIYNRAVKAGGKVTFLDERIYHHEPSSLSDYARKFYRYGFYYISALRQNSRLVLSHSMPRRAYFSTKALKQPTLFPALFLLYLIKGAATFAGVISYFLMKNE